MGFFFFCLPTPVSPVSGAGTASGDPFCPPHVFCGISAHFYSMAEHHAAIIGKPWRTCCGMALHGPHLLCRSCRGIFAAALSCLWHRHSRCSALSFIRREQVPGGICCFFIGHADAGSGMAHFFVMSVPARYF